MYFLYGSAALFAVALAMTLYGNWKNGDTTWFTFLFTGVTYTAIGLLLWYIYNLVDALGNVFNQIFTVLARAGAI